MCEAGTIMRAISRSVHVITLTAWIDSAGATSSRSIEQARIDEKHASSYHNAPPRMRLH